MARAVHLGLRQRRHPRAERWRVVGWARCDRLLARRDRRARTGASVADPGRGGARMATTRSRTARTVRRLRRGPGLRGPVLCARNDLPVPALLHLRDPVARGVGRATGSATWTAHGAT